MLPDCRVLAMGLSKSYGGLPALPGVMPELEAVVHDPAVPESHGPMDGRLLPNEQFTLAALKNRAWSPGRVFLWCTSPVILCWSPEAATSHT